MTDASQGSQPTPVPEGAIRVDAVRACWAWTAPEVWTERMLTALAQGVRGGRWYTLMDKVYAAPPLRAAFARVKANRGAAGVDHVTVAMYEARLDANLTSLSQSLRDGTDRPQAIRRHWIPKGPHARRPLGIPTVRDRVVQTARRLVLEPIFDVTFASHSDGFRPGRGAKDALRRVNALLRAGSRSLVDADLEAYFDTIPHAPVQARVASKVSDSRVLALIDAFLHQPSFEGLAAWTVDEGTPQGAVISPLLANLYLDPLDQTMAAAGFEMVRDADDFVILCRSADDAAQALGLVHRWTEAAGLRLHPEKTRLVDMHQPGGFDFLGSHFEGRYRRPRKKSLQKLKAAVRQKTRRTNGHGLAVIIADVNRTLVGGFGYFTHSHGSCEDLDAWIRTRLRSILRKRVGGRRRGRTADHLRWPVRFFMAQGLFSLQRAHAALRQSRAGCLLNWRAGCGQSARPVRREGERTQSFLPTPIGSVSSVASALKTINGKIRFWIFVRVLLIPVVLLLAIGLIDVVPVYTQSSGTLTGTVYDPVGAPIEGILVSIESGLFGAGISEQMPTDKAGQYRFEKLPPGIYTITLATEFAPSFEVSVGEGQLVRQDIRMQIEEVIGTFSVCVDCDPSPRYIPPDSLVREFAGDREAAAKQSVRGAEPTVGWEYYEPDVRVTEAIRQRGPTGAVVLEARVEPDGVVTNVRVVSSPHAELSAAAAAALHNERWNAATVRGVAVAAPLRLTIEFVRQAKPQ